MKALLTLKNFKEIPSTDAFRHCADEEGRDWYDAQKLFQPHTLKVCYTGNGGIVSASRDASALYPEGTSVTEFETKLLDKEIYDRNFKVNLLTMTLEEIIRPLDEQLREQRDMLLQELDGLAANPLRWNSFSVDQQEQLAQYRQALLDVPQQAGFPDNVSWPMRPNFIQ